MKATKTKSGKWRVLAYKKVDGKSVRKSFTADTRAQATLRATLWAKAEKYSNGCETPLREAVAAYIDAKEKVLSPSTIRAYRMYLNSIPWETPINELTSEKVQKMINTLSVEKSPKTVKNVFSLMNAAVNFMEPGTKWHVTLPKAQIRQSTIPTDEIVVEMLRKASPELRKAIILGALGGLRRGEICGLTYGDIIREHNIIHVHSDIVRDSSNHYVRKDRPKNDTSDRYVEMSPEAIRELGEGSESDPVVPLVPHSITTGFDRLRASLGVSVRFHDLRHYSASIMHALGVPDVYIMARHGWKTDSTLKKVYREVLEDKKNPFTEKTNAYFSGLMETIEQN